MKEINYIMTTMTENSLIIIDELCRSTSLEEGTAIAIAVVEKMAQSSAFIYITTHFTLLTKLYDMYLNVKLWQLETIPSGEDPKTFKLDFKYNLVSGVTSVKRYGVYLVRNIWPDNVLKYVDEMLDNITKKPVDPKIVAIDEKVRLKYNTEAKFRKLKSQNKLTVAEVNKLLSRYQTGLQKLGYSINVFPLSSDDSFTEHIEANMPQIRHSILENSQSFPEYNQNYEEEGLQSRDERLKQIFTPEASMSSQISISDPEARKTEKRLKDIFTPEQSQASDNYSLPNYSYSYQNNINFGEYDGGDISDTSSYQNISNFIGENSENIHKLIPEVNILSNLSQSNSDIFQNMCGPCCSDPEPEENKFDRTSSIDLSKDMNDFRFSLPLHNDAARTSTPVKHREPRPSQSSSPVVHIYSQRRNFSTPSSNNLDFNQNHHKIAQPEIEHSIHLEGIDLESLREDLEVCSKIFTESDDDFEDSLSTTYKSLPDDTDSLVKKPFHLNIMPTVTIIEGPNNTTLSIDGDDLREEANNTAISEAQEPKTKINVISDIAVTASGNIKVKKEQTPNCRGDSERSKVEKDEHHKSLNEDSIAKQFNSDERTESSSSLESDDGQIRLSRETPDNPNTNYRNTEPIPSDDSFGSPGSDKASLEDNEGQIDYNENTNASYKSIEGDEAFQRQGTKFTSGKPKFNDIDESYKSLKEHENLNELPEHNTTINKTPEKLNVNSSDHDIIAIKDHRNVEIPLEHSNVKENCVYNEELEDISSNSKCVDEKRKSEDKSKPSTNITTSISNASKLRNLDQVTSDSSVVEEGSTKKTSSTNNNDKTITSISSASKKRNLDDVTTTSSTSDQSNNKSKNEIRALDKSETTSSHKESDTSDTKKKKVAKKQFSVPRSAENRKIGEGSQTSATTSEKSKTNKCYVNQRKFVPPRKLSAKEIREEFQEQDRKMLESSPGSSDFSKYLEQLIKRPSVKQIQSTTHVALIRKTHEGVEVIPAEPARKKRKRSPLRKHFSNEKFDVTIFSDKNAVPFENYLKSDVKDYKTFNFNFGATQENTTKEKFPFVPTVESLSEYTNTSVTKHFVRTVSGNVQSKGIRCQENVKTTLVRRNSGRSENCQIFLQKSFEETLTPDGFYKQNKDDITRILNKYLQSGSQPSQQGGYFNRGDDKKRNIFENTDLSSSDLNI